MGTFLISSVESNQVNNPVLLNLGSNSGGEILPEGAEIVINFAKGFDTRIKTLKINQLDGTGDAIETISLQYVDVYGETVKINNRSIEYITDTQNINDRMPNEIISKVVIRILKLKTGVANVKLTVQICGCYVDGRTNCLNIQSNLELTNISIPENQYRLDRISLY